MRVLQEREFQRLGGTRVLRTDARIVAATNRDLVKAIANGQFREDLYYRLNVFAIGLPPLRDRRDDILPLCESFLADIGRSLGRTASDLSRDAQALLLEHHWPGNVRELRNTLERASILCNGGPITTDHLALPIVHSTPAAAARTPYASAAPAPAVPGPDPRVPSSPSCIDDLHSLERTMIEQALHAARFNKSKAAKALGLTRRQLYVRMRRHQMD